MFLTNAWSTRKCDHAGSQRELFGHYAADIDPEVLKIVYGRLY